MKYNLITAEDVLKHDPTCWTEEQLKEKLGKGKTLLQILDMDDVNIDNKIWCVTKFLDDDTNRTFAIWCARQCKTDRKEITEFCDVIERHYSGKATKKELNRANRAAYSAADRAADRAAFSVAYCAAYWAADRAAYLPAYWAADKSVNKEKMRKKQIKKLKELSKGGE